jgi:carbon-monoxide dehydrogenase medium subunit
MIPAAFDYQKVKTVDEAIAALSAGNSKILAGGHSLLPAMKLRLAHPAKLVDINGISGLKGVKEEDGEIVIGAATTHAEIGNDKIIKSKLPFFAEGALMIGDLQIRNHGTIGGNLAHADPASDWPALVLAADAAIEVQGKSGRKRIKATDFFTGLFSTALQDNEIIVAIRVPVLPDGTKTTYQKFVQPASRFAIVGCAAVRFPDGKINIGFTGIADNAFFTNDPETDLSSVIFLDDHYASAEYRKHLAKVYLKKALKAVS